MARENTTRYALLGVLSYCPMSGYDIKKTISNSIGYFWNENYGHIYTMLKRLYKEGCVNKETQENEGKPNRIVYSITDRGRNELNEWLNQPPNDIRFRNELLLKLFFSQSIPPEEAINKIKMEYEKNINLLSEYHEIEKRIVEGDHDPYVKDLWLITLNYGKYCAEVTLKWCDDSINSLSKYKYEENK